MKIINDRLALAYTLILLLNESYNTGNKNPLIDDLASKVLEKVKKPAISNASGDINSLILSLHGLVEEVLARGTKEPIELQGLELQLKFISINFKEIHQLVMDELATLPNKTQDDVSATIGTMYNTLRNFYNSRELKKVFAEHFFKLEESKGQLEDPELFITELMDQCAPLINKGAEDKLAGISVIHDHVDFSNEEQFTQAFETSKELNTDEGMMTTDVTGWNELFGGGIRRGEIIDMDALTGHGKSDTLRRIIRGIASATKPFNFFGEEKIPTLLIISMEDTVDMIISKMYSDMYEEEFGKRADLDSITPKEAWEFVYSRINKNGYHLEIIYCKKHQVGVRDIARIINVLEAQNKEIHIMGVDYLQLMRYDDMPGANPPTQIKNVLGMMGDVTKPKKITLLTCNQLGSVAKQFLSDGEVEFARVVVGKSLQENCKSITNEVDMELATHIIKGDDGHYYHQLAIGKHRNGKYTPTEAKYAVYRMHSDDQDRKAGFIKGDLGEEFSRVRNSTAGQYRVQGGGEASFF